MSDIETRVRDAITMNVDLMEGPARIVERAVVSADRVRRSRRRRRALAVVLIVIAGVCALAGVAFAAPTTAMVQAKLASWVKIQDAGGAAGWKGDIAPWFARLPDHGA